MFTVLENIQVAFVSLRNNKLRTALTMLGITIGVAAVVVLLSIGKAVEGVILQVFEETGSNYVAIMPIIERDRNNKVEWFTMGDAEAISDTFLVPGAKYVVPTTVNILPVVYGDKQLEIGIEGTTPDYVTIYHRPATRGRFFTQDELDRSARVALIGPATAERLFGNEDPIGKFIRIRNVRFEIIGILKDFPDPEEASYILVPLTTAQTRLSGERILSGERPLYYILIQARDKDSVQEVEDQVTKIMRERRGIKPGEDDNFMVISDATILEILTGIIGTFTLFLGVVAGISLLVGGIGVMNIMLVTVTERTREIGLRKAVGARNRDIIQQFLVETIVITLLGGAVGILIAAAGGALVTALVDNLDVSVQPFSVVLALVISIIIGTFFGIYPARRAARLNPIDALRYE